MRSVTSNSSPLVRNCPPLWSGSLVPWSRCRYRALSYLPLSRARIGTSVFRFCLLVSASSSVCSDMRASTPYTRPATTQPCISTGAPARTYRVAPAAPTRCGRCVSGSATTNTASNVASTSTTYPSPSTYGAPISTPARKTGPAARYRTAARRRAARPPRARGGRGAQLMQRRGGRRVVAHVVLERARGQRGPRRAELVAVVLAHAHGDRVGGLGRARAPARRELLRVQRGQPRVRRVAARRAAVAQQAPARGRRRRHVGERQRVRGRRRAAPPVRGQGRAPRPPPPPPPLSPPPPPP